MRRSAELCAAFRKLLTGGLQHPVVLPCGCIKCISVIQIPQDPIKIKHEVQLSAHNTEFSICRTLHLSVQLQIHSLNCQKGWRYQIFYLESNRWKMIKAWLIFSGSLSFSDRETFTL